MNAPRQVLLRDGTPVLLRPVTPEDEGLIIRAFEKLSVHSRYYRFWSRLNEMPATLAKRLADDDNGRHIVWAAQHPDSPLEPGLGAASIWQSASDPQEAEISFTIADEAQHRGVGTLLLAVLWLAAEERGIHRFLAHALADNYAVKDWFLALGASVELSGSQLSFTLSVDRGKLPTSRQASSLIRWLEELGQAE